MHEYHVSQAIAAPAERVWSVLADVERWPEWTASIQRLEPLTSPPLGVGSRVRVRQPKLPVLVWTVTEWQPGRGFAWETASPGIRVVAGHEVEPDATGCRVHLRLRLEGPLTPILVALQRRLTERYLGLEADGLKARSERAR